MIDSEMTALPEFWECYMLLFAGLVLIFKITVLRDLCCEERSHRASAKQLTLLQIRRGNRDNSGIILHNTPLKHML